MKLPRMSIKWKIFLGCFWLSIAIVAFNWFYSNAIVHRSASKTGNELKAAFRRFETFQAVRSSGMAAAVDVWATQPRLQDTFAKGDDEAVRPLLTAVEQMLGNTIKPDFVLLVDKHGDLSRSKDCPIEQSDSRTMRVFADLKQGMSIDNAIVEVKRRSYLVAAEPVLKEREVVGAVMVGRRLDKLFAEFKLQSDDDPRKQVEMTLVHNQDATASSAPQNEWDAIARATVLDQRVNVHEAGRTVSVIQHSDGRWDFFSAQMTGYDGAATGSIGSLFVMRSRFEKERDLHAMVHEVLIVTCGALVVAALVSFILSWLVTRPLKTFIDATHDLAHGEGDLTKRLDVECSAAEMSQLAMNLNAMFAHLQKLASEVQGASFQVGASSAEISAASKQMLGGASDQATKIESSTAAVTEMSSSIQTVAENAAQATRVAQESGDALARGIKRLNDIETIVQETADKIAALGHSGKRIGNIVEVIRQISEQTSLLALNASIEAAHAGEQGRGFAVVADEVSSLARRVGQSAKDIETLIATISDQTVDAVSSMQRVTREFADQTSGSNALQSALRRIIETVGETARSVQEQAIVSDEIARNMDAVRKIANEVLTSSQEAVIQGEQLHELALRLETLVRGFRINSEGGDELDGNGTPRIGGRARAAALPERSSERRKVARS
jgi:methyl-accepting chemotaxis protein